MTRLRRLIVYVAVCCVGIGAGSMSATLSAAAPASNAESEPCWQTIIHEWYSGPIKITHPIHCYDDALANVCHAYPTLCTYSSVRDDIESAKQKALRYWALKHRGNGGNDPDTTTTTRTGPPTTTDSTSTQTTTGPNRTDPTTTETTGVETTEGDGGSSIPFPLIILGGLAVALIAVGGAGMLKKRGGGDPTDPTDPPAPE